MTLNNAKARFELTATATPTGTSVTGPNVIGTGLTTANYPSASKIVSYKVVSGGAAATSFFLSNCTATTLSGSPAISDADGIDFEGVALGAMNTVYGVSYRYLTGTGVISVSGTVDLDYLPDIVMSAGSALVFSANSTGVSTSVSRIVTTHTANSTIVVTILGA